MPWSEHELYALCSFVHNPSQWSHEELSIINQLSPTEIVMNSVSRPHSVVRTLIPYTISKPVLGRTYKKML